MLVLNAERTSAIVIRHDGQNVRLVPMKAGRLTVSRCTRARFDSEWRAADVPLAPALDDFLAHANRQGATVEALKGLENLAQRDRWVVSNLF